MGLESAITDLVKSTTELTQEVANKQGQIDARVTAKIAELENWRSGARAEYPVINTFANNLLWSGVASGVENGVASVKGTVPTGFYEWIANAEAVIQGTRPFVSNEYGMKLPNYCPSPTVLRMKFIPRPGTSPAENGGRPVVPLPFAWGYPQPIAGRYVTHSFYARVVSGAASIATTEGYLIETNWRQVATRTDGNDGLRAHWMPRLADFNAALELEFMLPHTFLGWIPDASLPVYAKAVQML